MTTNGKQRRAVRLVVVREGAAPACMETGRVLCRGCPGWRDMNQALLDPDSGWQAWPIHCPATGLTVRLED